MIIHVSTEKPKLTIISERIEDDCRFYLDDTGREHISVTSLLGPYMDKTALVKWKERIGEAEADKICEERVAIGKEAHTALENYFEGIPTNNRYAISAIKHLYRHVTLLSVEEVVFFAHPMNDTASYAGRYDQLVWVPKNTLENEYEYIEEGNYIADLKTKRKLPGLDSFSFYVKHLLQASAYYNALKTTVDVKGFLMVAVGARKVRTFCLDVALLEYYWSLYETLLLDFYGDRRILKQGHSFWYNVIDRPLRYDIEVGAYISRYPSVVWPSSTCSTMKTD